MFISSYASTSLKRGFLYMMRTIPELSSDKVTAVRSVATVFLVRMSPLVRLQKGGGGRRG